MLFTLLQLGMSHIELWRTSSCYTYCHRSLMCESEFACFWLGRKVGSFVFGIAAVSCITFTTVFEGMLVRVGS